MLLVVYHHIIHGYAFEIKPSDHWASLYQFFKTFTIFNTYFMLDIKHYLSNTTFGKKLVTTQKTFCNVKRTSNSIGIFFLGITLQRVSNIKYEKRKSLRRNSWAWFLLGFVMSLFWRNKNLLSSIPRRVPILSNLMYNMVNKWDVAQIICLFL